MKRLLRSAVLAGVTAMLFGLPIQVTAQQGGGGGGRGNFDPEAMRQRMMDRYKEVLGITKDEEWQAIEPRIQKITDARRDVGFGGMRGMFGGGRRGGPGGGGDTAQADQGANRRNNPFGQPSVAAQDLQKALDSNASAETIKTKLAAYREDRKAKQEKLEAAQADLKKVLTSKQEAAAVLAGLLD